MKTIPILNATKIPRGEHRKLESFGGYCFVVSRSDKILLHKRNFALKQNAIIFFSQKRVVYRLMYSHYENLNILMWESKLPQNNRRFSALVFKWIVT